VTVRRVMGIETEYGILSPSRPAANPMLLSSHVVAAYTALTSPSAGHARWDYADEDPLADARGFRLDRGSAHPSLLTDDPAMPDVALYKNNVDGKGASYGTHENYLVDRAVPFDRLVEALTPFLVTRQVFAGAGRVGIGPTGEVPGFQISQRADYIEAEVGLETTLRRPIVNTRDEPHADRTRWRRLHLILGDATLLEVATFLRLGTTSLVLWLVEQAQERPGLLDFVPGLALADPVGAVREVSRDLSLSARLETVHGGTVTALDVQRAYLTAVRTAVGRPDDATAEVLARWESVLDRLARDPASCAREVEWVAKWRLLEAMRTRDRIGWDHPRLAAMDIQWSDVRPERGLYHRLVAAGAVERLVTDEDVARAEHDPPVDTRAYFRGTVVRRFPGQVRAASWDSVVLDVPTFASLRRVPLRDPWRGTRAHVGALLDDVPDAATLVERLAGG